MSNFPCLVRLVSGSGQVRYRLGERLVDRYLEFVAGRCRPNTLRAVAFDLKSFFAVIGKDPVEVTAVDVFDFLADQRGDRTVIRLADRESGLSARTIARRLSSVSGLYAYLVARGDTPVQVNPVPRGLMTSGEDWFSSVCGPKREPCAGCGKARVIYLRDRDGRPRCARCPPGGDPVAIVTGVVAVIDPELPAETVAAAVTAATQAGQRHQLAWALQ